MKVGTDAMLLGSWASPPFTRPCRILDVGTGTGVLALMMAQKTDTSHKPSTSSVDPAARPMAGIGDNDPNRRATCCNVDAGASALNGGGSGTGAYGGNTAAAAYILAIDVDEGACEQATENAALSPWSRRIRVVHSSLQQLVKVAAEAVAEAPVARREASGSLATATLTDVSTAAAVTATALPSFPSPSSSYPAYPSSSLMPSASSAAPFHTLRSLSHPPVTSAPSAPSLECSKISITTADMGPFDLIISNPPYFVASSKPAQGRKIRATARHADVSLPFVDLAAGCAALLAPHGSVCVVLPPDEAERFCAAAALCGLVLVEQLLVYTTPEDSRERRRLMRLARAIDLPGGAVEPSATPTATTSILVINGPKERSQPLPQPPTVGAAFATLTDDSSNRKNTSQRSPATAAAATHPATETPNAKTPAISNTHPTRLFTAQYLNLTKNFHHPAFFSSLSAASGSAIEVVVSS